MVRVPVVNGDNVIADFDGLSQRSSMSTEEDSRKRRTSRTTHWRHREKYKSLILAF